MRLTYKLSGLSKHALIRSPSRIVMMFFVALRRSIAVAAKYNIKEPPLIKSGAIKEMKYLILYWIKQVKSGTAFS